jgi:hypothetical protein
MRGAGNGPKVGEVRRRTSFLYMYMRNNIGTDTQKCLCGREEQIKTDQSGLMLGKTSSYKLHCHEFFN